MPILSRRIKQAKCKQWQIPGLLGDVIRGTSSVASVIEQILQRAQEKEVLRLKLPRLKDAYKRTSDATGTYNCIAHAAYDCKRNWWPVPGDFARNDRYWPREAPPRRTIRAFKKAFELQGFTQCYNGQLEAAYEKVVLYVSDK